VPGPVDRPAWQVASNGFTSRRRHSKKYAVAIDRNVRAKWISTLKPEWGQDQLDRALTLLVGFTLMDKPTRTRNASPDGNEPADG
jgi:hypothetical protein